MSAKLASRSDCLWASLLGLLAKTVIISVASYIFACLWQLYRSQGGNCTTFLVNWAQAKKNRGYIHYQGMPKLCRKCGEQGHLAEACSKVVCGKCREIGHSFEKCTNGRKCNLCGDLNHLFRDCPKSFANKLQQNGKKMTDESAQTIVETRLEPIALIGGEGEGPVVAPPSGEVEEGGGAQAAGGSVTESTSDSDETGSLQTVSQEEESEVESSEASLPGAQPGKRAASELSSEAQGASEKRGRAGSSENTSVEEARVFPNNPPNTLSFLHIALQSTPKDSVLDHNRLWEGNEAENLYSSPIVKLYGFVLVFGEFFSFVWLVLSTVFFFPQLEKDVTLKEF